jgi:hypothetical protein
MDNVHKHNNCLIYHRHKLLDFIFRDSSVGISTGSVLGGRGLTPGRGRRFFLSGPQYPDRLWGPPNLLSSGYLGGGSFPGDKAAGVRN